MMATPALEVDDIQSGVLRPRSTPFAATYIIFRIDDRNAGRELMRRLSAVVGSVAAHPASPARDTWVSAALSFQGLRALGVPKESLDSFPLQFQQGMAARAKVLGDVGESSPQNWEKPLGSPDVHVVLTAISPDQEHLEIALDRARQAYHALPGITAIWRQDCHAAPDEKEPFGFKDGISHPAIEGSGIPGTNPQETPLKAGLLRPHVQGFSPQCSPAKLLFMQRAASGRALRPLRSEDHASPQEVRFFPQPR